MLLKKNRLIKKDVDILFKNGKFVFSKFFNIKFLFLDNLLHPKISFIVPRNIAKTAVKRNLLRRKAYNVLKKYIKDFPTGFISVFVFKIKDIDISNIENEIKNLLNKIN